MHSVTIPARSLCRNLISTASSYRRLFNPSEQLRLTSVTSEFSVPKDLCVCGVYVVCPAG
jgi:hypothetical protein